MIRNMYHSLCCIAIKSFPKLNVYFVYDKMSHIDNFVITDVVIT